MEEKAVREEGGRAMRRDVLEGDMAWPTESAYGLSVAIPSCPMLTAL